jgi:hypothetical protein
MPRQNRVTPFGEVIATPERGTFFGNRGVLHNAEGNLCRSWQVKRWLVCVPEFRGRRRPLADPGRYTALFFLDEPTALAAGHRPCFECRRPRFHAFQRAWIQGNPGLAQGSEPTAEFIDDRLHAERLGPGGAKRTFEARLEELPDGVFVTGEMLEGRAWLWWKGRLLAWSSGGYREWHAGTKGGMRVSVLTPASTVGALRAGYSPEIHPSAVNAGAVQGVVLAEGSA